MSGALAREVITIPFLASPESRIVTIESDLNKSTVPYGYRIQKLVIPPSVKDMNLPINLFCLLSPLSPATITEKTPQFLAIDHIPKQEELFDVSNESTQSMMACTIKVW